MSNDCSICPLARAATTVGERAGRRPASPESHDRCPYSRSITTTPGRWCPRDPQIAAGAVLPPTIWGGPPAYGSASPAPRGRRHAPGQPADATTGSRERTLVVAKEARDAVRALPPQQQRHPGRRPVRIAAAALR